jgi:hypothetical protein
MTLSRRLGDAIAADFPIILIKAAASATHP